MITNIDCFALLAKEQSTSKPYVIVIRKHLDVCVQNSKTYINLVEFWIS